MPEKNIRDEIVEKRKARIAEMGFAEGADVPRKRETPIVPFLGDNGLICEIKRRSPSKGIIADGLDAVEQAGVYVKAGAGNLSVLTEPTGFGGSLEDLMRVKRAFPNVAVLRKDFLHDPHDIDIAWRAGADAVLLIAGMLTEDQFNLMYRCAKSLGLQVLVEIHDREDLRKVRGASPDLMGINSRDLTTFRIDPMLPVTMKTGIDWKAKVVYESGIGHPDQAAFAVGAGFYGLLVGEGVVRDPGLAGKLLDVLRTVEPNRFWPEVGKRLFEFRGEKPLVKVCGLAREEDARLAADLGADLLGFVFWSKSPRCAREGLLRAVKDVEVPKVGVVVAQAGAQSLPGEVRSLLEEGLLDAVQFHGDEEPDDLQRLWPVHYKAFRPSGAEEVAAADAFRAPRVLLDASADVPGGSGKRVGQDILNAWTRPLWLAGGITPDNAGRIVETRKPELIDVASGVEAEPGVKSRDKVRRFFDAAGR